MDDNDDDDDGNEDDDDDDKLSNNDIKSNNDNNNDSLNNKASTTNINNNNNKNSVDIGNIDNKNTDNKNNIHNNNNLDNKNNLVNKNNIDDMNNIGDNIVNTDHTYAQKRPSYQQPAKKLWQLSTLSRKNRQQPHITVKWFPSSSPLRCCFSRRHQHRNRRKNIVRCNPRTPVYHLHFHYFH